MSLEDSADTLPGIIKSLAQQVYSRDAQLERDRAKYVEELSAFREQRDAMRRERDSSLHVVKEVELQRNQLAEELGKEKAQTEKIKAAYDLEKAELLKQVELLQKAAIHHAEVLTRAQYEVAAWEQRWEEWSLHFSQMKSKLDELTEAWRNSKSSPTVVDSSLSPNKPSSTDESPLANPRHRAPVMSNTVNQLSTPTSSTRCRTRIVHPDHADAASVDPIKKNSPSRSRPREISKGVVNQSQRNSTHKPAGNSSLGTTEVSKSHAVKSPSHLAFPPDRVVHTAYFEIKHEGNDVDLPFQESDTSEALLARVDDAEDDEILSAKRKRSSMRKRRRIEDEEDYEQQEDADEMLYQIGARKRLRQIKKQDDHDEIAIGSEDNHREVYGYKRVHVREVNTGRVPRRHGGQAMRHN